MVDHTDLSALYFWAVEIWKDFVVMNQKARQKATVLRKIFLVLRKIFRSSWTIQILAWTVETTSTIEF